MLLSTGRDICIILIFEGCQEMALAGSDSRT